MPLRLFLAALPGLALAIASTVAGSMLGAWIGVLLAYASHFAVALHVAPAEVRPFRRWLVLIGLCMGCVAHVTWRVTARQGSNTLERSGVFLLNDSAETRIGISRPGLDVRLEADGRESESWEVRVRPTETGYQLASVDGVDWIERRRASGGASLVWGAELSRESPSIVVRDTRQKPVSIELEASGVRGGLRIGSQRFLFDDPEEVHDQRLRRALRFGAEAGDLRPRGKLSPEMASCFRISLEEEGIVVGGIAIRWPLARVAAREPTCKLDFGDGIPSRAFSAGDTLRVVVNGKAWRFIVGDEGRAGGRRGIRVTFVRRPRARLSPIPARATCGEGVACAILTTRHLPPPVAQVFLGGAGLDTLRYGLLGRLEQDDKGARLVQRNGATALPYNQYVGVGLDRLRGNVDGGYVLRVRRVNVASALDLALPIVALLMLWIGTALALLRVEAFRDLQTGATSRSRLLWSLLSALSILSALRLALGLRSALAEPYNERGEATAIGLWIALPLTILVLVGTVALWPRVVAAIERRATRRNSGEEEPRSRGGRLAAERVHITLDLGSALVVISLAVLAWREWEAVKGAMVVTVSVLFAWMGFGLTRPTGNRRRERVDPISTLLMPPPESAQVAGLLLTGVFVILIALAFYSRELAIVISIAAALALLVFGLPLAWALWSRAELDTALALSRMRGAEAALMLAMLAGVSLFVEGPFSLFAAVFVLYLFAARVGMIHGWRIRATQHAVNAPSPGSQEVAVSEASGAAAPGPDRRLLLTPALRRFLLDAFVLVVPLLCLIPVTILDFGLGLICLVPLLATVLVAADFTRFSTGLQILALVLVLGLVTAVRPVLLPDTRALHEAGSFGARDSVFRSMGGASGRLARAFGAEGAFARATVRSIAARDPEALEKVLVAAGPSVARDEILRSIEQAWGGRVYAAAGWGGEGLARSPMEGRGISRPTAVAENVFATFIASEHGFLGVLGVFSVFAFIVVVVVAWFLSFSISAGATEPSPARYALVLGGTLWLTVPAAYVALGNLGAVPLTGQNIPFLGLNSWSDVLFSVAICSTLLLAILFTERPDER